MILCIGTTPTLQRTMTFEGLHIDQVNRAKTVHEFASGKSINVARVLRVLGQPSLAVGLAGGRRGAALIEDLDGAGLEHELIPIANQTRLCTTLIDGRTGAVTELVEEAASSPDEWAALDRLIESRIGQANVVVYSGTLAPGAPADFCSRWIRAGGPVVIVDAKGPPMKLAMAREGCIAKLNREELEMTVERKFDSVEQLIKAMPALMPIGGKLFVTLGREGCIASDGRAVYQAGVAKVEVINPIGSGDSFAAGLAAGVLRGEDFERQVLLASACAVANAMTAHSGLVHLADVNAVLEEIKVRRVG